MNPSSTDQVLVAFNAYQAALQRWPGYETALIGSGNTVYTLHRFNQSILSTVEEVGRPSEAANSGGAGHCEVWRRRLAK